jgi:hypothetical protein
MTCRHAGHDSQAKCNVNCKAALGDTPLVLAQKGLTHAIIKGGDKVHALNPCGCSSRDSYCSLQQYVLHFICVLMHGCVKEYAHTLAHACRSALGRLSIFSKASVPETPCWTKPNVSAHRILCVPRVLAYRCQ